MQTRQDGTLEEQVGRETIDTLHGKARIFRLRLPESSGRARADRLPFTIKILLESLLRNQERLGITNEDLIRVASRRELSELIEIPVLPSRVVMQDASGVPALVDLASLRQRLADDGLDPQRVNPVIPVDLVVDHSVQVDFYGSADALDKNVRIEYERNRERYEFLKWAQKSFQGLRVIPPSSGIIHQVNMEFLSSVVQLGEEDGSVVAYPEMVIGTDSHTTMINGLGVLGWGVGGIEAEAVMLGRPITMVVPEVFGVRLCGRPKEGVTATDIALTVTQQLRSCNVVGKFVEYFGPGLKELTLPDRATIANMAPEYGATCGFFPIDEETLRFLRLTGKSEADLDLVEKVTKALGLFYTVDASEAEYADVLELDLSSVEPSAAGPKRPQDRIPLHEVGASFRSSFGFDDHAVPIGESRGLRDGSIVVAAITSCTNTANPVNMIGAGLLSKKAVEYGLRVPDYIQTSLAPGSKAVTRYLEKAGLLPYLEKLGFYHVGYGCTVCVGNSGSLPDTVEQDIRSKNLTVTSVLSGNRNFEGRIHPLVKANYLASPPLVVAFAIAGTVNIDLLRDPLGLSSSGEPVFLKDIWPSSEEIHNLFEAFISSDLFREAYANVLEGDESWNGLAYDEAPLYRWNEKSTYFKPSPFFERDAGDGGKGGVRNARALLVLGDSITTDHISPVGTILADSPAGKYLMANGVEPADFNTYGARRGNHEALIRGTFANPRLKNMLAEKTGGYTVHLPSGETLDIYEAAMRYKEENTPLAILAGKEYGTGSARDWAAKGTYLLGVKMVIAESFERIHRSNLAMLGVLPLQFMQGENLDVLGLAGDEQFSVLDLDEAAWIPRKPLRIEAVRQNGSRIEFQALLRLDTSLEIETYRCGGVFHSIADTWTNYK